MEKKQKDFCQKALLMIALAGAVLGVARAGYDEGAMLEEDSRASSESAQMRQMHVDMLVQTLSEEFTEVEELASQQAKFRQMGDSESTQIARMYGRWIREHKAGVPALARLIRIHGGNPEDAKELKNPTLGTKDEMLMETHNAHQAAVKSSQMRYAMTGEWGIQWFMHNRANLARKHLAEMSKYHSM